MSVKEKLEALEEMMDLEEDTITLEMNLEDIEEWDSMSKLYLMAYVKKEFGQKLTVEEMRQFQTIEDICNYMGN